MKDLLFIIFGILTLSAGCAVVISRRAIHSVLNLILTFFGLSALYVLWGAEFIAMIQVLVYAGAIVVLFLFVVMLLNLKKEEVRQTRLFTILFCGALAWGVSLLFLRTLNTFAPTLQGSLSSADIRTVSLLLFTDYLWPFEVLSLFLLMLIVAVFALARPIKEPKERL